MHQRDLKHGVPRVVSLALLIVFCLGSSCPDGGIVPIPLARLPKDVAFFGDDSGAEYLGKLLIVYNDGTVAARNYDASIAWSTQCGENAQMVQRALQNRFFVLPVKDSVRAEANAKLWEEVRANWGLVAGSKDSDDLKARFVALFSSENQAKAGLVYNTLKTPITEFDLSPSARLGFSRTDFDGGLNVKLTDRFQSAFKYKDVTLHFFATSQWGRLALSPPVRDCLLAVAKAMQPRPTHIVDSISLGILFKFEVLANEFAGKLSGASPGVVEVSAAADFRKTQVSAALFGEVRPENYKVSVADIYNRDSGAQPDAQILSYFTNLASSVKTPVVVSAHLLPVN